MKIRFFQDGGHLGFPIGMILGIFDLVCLFVLRFYDPVNPMGHVERGQLT